MTDTPRRRKISTRTILLATTVAAMAYAVGFGAAASLTISAGNVESGGGSSHAANALAYWTEASVGIGAQPSPAAPLLSGAAATPTVIAAAGTDYAINTATPGDVVHFWKFTEATTAPTSTEVEIQFTVTGATAVSVTDYIETQTTAPSTSQTFVLYYDLGGPTTTITLNSVLAVEQQCASVGSCP